MTTRQIEKRFWSDSAPHNTRDGQRKINPRCQERLKKLFHYEYLDRREQPQRLSEGRRSLVYFPGPRAHELLPGDGFEQPVWKPGQDEVSMHFLAHTLGIVDLRISFELAAMNRPPLGLSGWFDDRALKSPGMKDTVTVTGPRGGSERVAVVPDAYCQLRDPEKGNVWHHLIEFDRGTVTLRSGRSALSRRDWLRKIRAYIVYCHLGLYRRRFGAKGVRILTVTTSRSRLERLKAITEEAGGKGRFWFTTKKAAMDPEAILNADIWYKAGSKARFSLL